MSDSQNDTVTDIAEKISEEINRRQRQAHAIDELITERQEVLVGMYELATREVSQATASSAINDLRAFSQKLVDYTALGHFEIYERIIDGKERRSKVRQIANDVYPLISRTTEQFVEFNDKYDGIDDSESLEGLHADLSIIGEALAERIESEDILLNELSDKISSHAS